MNKSKVKNKLKQQSWKNLIKTSVKQILQNFPYETELHKCHSGHCPSNHRLPLQPLGSPKGCNAVMFQKWRSGGTEYHFVVRTNARLALNG